MSDKNSAPEARKDSFVDWRICPGCQHRWNVHRPEDAEHDCWFTRLRPGKAPGVGRVPRKDDDGKCIECGGDGNLQPCVECGEGQLPPNRWNKIMVCGVVHRIDLDDVPNDPFGWAMLLADAESDLLARQAFHAHISAEQLDALADNKKKPLPEHRLKAKLRSDDEHYKREIGVAEAHRSVVFLRAVVTILTGAKQ